MRGFRSEDAGKPDKLCDVAALIVRETASAFLLDHGDGEAWVPKSQVENNHDGTFTMPEWLATERGMV